MCDKFISDNPFPYYIFQILFPYVPDQYKTQKICDKAVDGCPAVLKFVNGWFVTRKMIKIHFTDLFTHKYML